MITPIFDTTDLEKEIREGELSSLNRSVHKVLIKERQRLKAEVEKVIDDLAIKQDLLLGLIGLGVDIEVLDRRRVIRIICEELKERLGI